MKTPDSTDCARSERLGSPIARRGYFVISVAPGAATLFGQTVTQRPFCTCFTRHQVVAVVARPVEAQLALDRVDLVLAQPVGEHLVVEALGRGDRGIEHLPRGIRRRGLRFDAGVGEPGLRRALVEELHELGRARIVEVRRMLLEDRRRERILAPRAPAPSGRAPGTCRSAAAACSRSSSSRRAAGCPRGRSRRPRRGRGSHPSRARRWRRSRGCRTPTRGTRLPAGRASSPLRARRAT